MEVSGDPTDNILRGAADALEDQGLASPQIPKTRTSGPQVLGNAPSTSVPLQQLCDKLRNNLDVVLQAHSEEIQRYASTLLSVPFPPPGPNPHGLSQYELDALAVGNTPLSRKDHGAQVDKRSPSLTSVQSGLSGQDGTLHFSKKALDLVNYEEESRCSSAKTLVRRSRSPSPAKLQGLSPPGEIPEADLIEDAPSSPSRCSTRSSSLSGMRGFLVEELDDLENFDNQDTSSHASQHVADGEKASANGEFASYERRPCKSPVAYFNISDSPVNAEGHSNRLDEAFESDEFMPDAFVGQRPEPPGSIAEESYTELAEQRRPCKQHCKHQVGSFATTSSPVDRKTSIGFTNSPVRTTFPKSGGAGVDEHTPPRSSRKDKQLKSSLSLITLDPAHQEVIARKSGQFFEPLSKRKLAALMESSTRLQRIVRSRSYEVASAFFIVLNIVFVMLETDLRASSVTSGSYSENEESVGDRISFITSNLFCAVFLLDLLLRIHTERALFLSREKGWNLFDCFVVLTAVVEVLVHWYEILSGTVSFARAFLRKLTMLRIIRLLRVISHTRAAGVIRFIRELRLMVFSITGTLKSLTWAIVLLTIILLVFGVFFTDGAVTYLVQNPGLSTESTSDLRLHFGSLTKATVTLYMAMSGGEDWGNVFRILQRLPGEYQWAFLGFITFAILALLNVVTAVFVEAAMKVYENDKELVVLEEMESKKEFVQVMQQVFQELDTNDSGALSLDEFEKHIEDAKLTAFLSSVGLDVSEVCTLFSLLDVDRTGEVDLDEFVQGCLRLKGGAKSMDMAILKYQVEWILHNVMSMEKRLDPTRDISPSGSLRGRQTKPEFEYGDPSMSHIVA